MATTYGSTPGIEVTTRGAAITGVIVGRAQKLVLFGNGDTNNGTASANDPVQITSGTDADDAFDASSKLAKALRDALANGANDEYLYGVAPGETTVSAESATQSGSTTNAPIVEGSITFTDTTDGDLTVKETYESPPQTPGNSDTVNINPKTGEYEADAAATGSYEVDYDYLDWTSALDSADNVLNEIESGVYGVLEECESVTSELATKIDNLRDPAYKLVRGVTGAEPNDDFVSGKPKVDVGNYTDNVDDDNIFLIANARQEDEDRTLIGAAAGLFGGHELTNPVYGDSMEGVTTAQTISINDRNDLRDSHQVIALRDEGDVTLHSNTSTSTQSDWERDFHRKRVVDQTILIARQLGDDVEGDINNDETQTVLKEELKGELEDLADDGLLEPNTSDETNQFVNVTEPSTDTIAVNMGITPEGVTKTIKFTIDIDA